MKVSEMGTQVIVNIASISSGLIIIISLIVVGILLKDINSFYYEVMDDMDEFKVCCEFIYIFTTYLL